MLISKQKHNQAVYICKHVFDATRDMDYVYFDEDASILITCSGSDHDFSNSAEVRVVGLGHLILRDSTLNDVPDLRPGAWAERKSRKDPWKTHRNG